MELKNPKIMLISLDRYDTSLKVDSGDSEKLVIEMLPCILSAPFFSRKTLKRRENCSPI